MIKLICHDLPNRDVIWHSKTNILTFFFQIAFFQMCEKILQKSNHGKDGINAAIAGK